MRVSCYDCCRKHLSQALVISHELPYYTGDEKDDHLWVWVGHMAEAADQIQKDHPDVAGRIRESRLKVMKDNNMIFTVDINMLIREISDLMLESGLAG